MDYKKKLVSASNLRNFLEFIRIRKQDVFLVTLSFVFFLLLSSVFTYIYFAQDLKTKEGIVNRNETGLTLLDRNLEPFFTFYEAKDKTFIPLSEIPDHTEQAIIASEDKGFYQHAGFSLRGILRSIIVDLKHASIVSGGSTITQQLVKNSLLSKEKSFLRKYQELVLALEIERRFNKSEILEMYLNSAYFGEGAFGVQEAAQAYFNKDAKDLDVAQSAALAALLPSPSRLSPYNSNGDLLREKQKIILEKMLEQKFISLSQKEAAEGEELKFTRPNNPVNTQGIHFALMVKDQLIKEYGEEDLIRSGFKVKTTIDLKTQGHAEKAVDEQVKNLKKNKVSNGAAVVIDPKTGEILSLVGSYNWFDDSFGKLNMATAPRQPGSAFKPIIYIAAFEKRLITPATIIKDEPITINIQGQPPYRPKNYDGKFRGNVLVRRALSNSLNIPSVQIMQKVGLPDGIDMAKRLGISSLEDPSYYGPSLVLGTGNVSLVELTGAYSVFANKGVKNLPTPILNIYDKYGREVYAYKPKGEAVVGEQFTFLVSSILSDSKTRTEIFGKALDISRVAAVKTGTTENFKDSLTVGYTPSLAIGVWVGNNDNTPMDNVAGSLGAAPIWKNLMETLLQNTPHEEFTVPGDIASIYVCKNQGLKLKEASSSGYLEYFVKGTEPTGFCQLPTIEKKQEVRKEEGKKEEERKEDKKEKEEKDKSD